MQGKPTLTSWIGWKWRNLGRQTTPSGWTWPRTSMPLLQQIMPCHLCCFINAHLTRFTRLRWSCFACQVLPTSPIKQAIHVSWTPIKDKRFRTLWITWYLSCANHLNLLTSPGGHVVVPKTEKENLDVVAIAEQYYKVWAQSVVYQSRLIVKQICEAKQNSGKTIWIGINSDVNMNEWKISGGKKLKKQEKKNDTRWKYDGEESRVHKLEGCKSQRQLCLPLHKGGTKFKW